MEKLKSSGMFENLKPSEEQKKKIYEKIMIRNSEEEQREIRIVSDNRFSMKNIFYPAAVLAAVTIAAVSAAYGSGRNDEVNTVPASLPEISDLQTPAVIADTDAEYSASVYKGSIPVMKTGECIYSIAEKHTGGQDLTAVASDGSEWIKPGKSGGISKIKQITDIAVYGDNVYITGRNDSPLLRYLYRTDSEFGSTTLIKSGNIADFCEYDGRLYLLMPGSDDSGTESCFTVCYSDEAGQEGYVTRKVSLPEKSGCMEMMKASLTVTDDGRIAEVFRPENRIYIYDRNLNLEETVEFPEDDQYSFAFGSSGRIISTDMKNHVKVYSVSDGELVCENTAEFENSAIVESAVGNKYDLIYFNWKTSDYCGYDAVNNRSEYLFRPKKGAGSYAGCFSTDGKTYELFNPLNENYSSWTVSSETADGDVKTLTVSENELGGVKKLEVETEGISGTEVRMTDYPSDWELEDVFVTSDNRIMLSIYTGYSESEYFIKELDTAAMELKDVRCTNRAFLRSAMKQTGTGKYEVFYSDDRGIYGIENLSRAGSYEMILDYRNVNFDFDFTEYEIRSAYEIRNYITGFSVSDSGEIFFETSKGINFKLEKK